MDIVPDTSVLIEGLVSKSIRTIFSSMLINYKPTFNNSLLILLNIFDHFFIYLKKPKKEFWLYSISIILIIYVLRLFLISLHF